MAHASIGRLPRRGSPAGIADVAGLAGLGTAQGYAPDATPAFRRVAPYDCPTPMARHLAVSATVLLLIVGSTAGCGAPAVITPSPSLTQAPSASATPAPSASATPAVTLPSPARSASQSPSAIPRFDHIYVVVMENREIAAIVGSRAAPYINGLIARYGLATNYHAVTHPSQPNYFALFAGTTFGLTDDANHDLPARNLADQIENRGLTWHVYAQNYPGACSPKASAEGGVDLTGAAGVYVRKHEPAISFTDISRRPSRCARITGLAGFSPTKASFELIIPNMTNDMHDGTVAQGDAFLRSFVPRILDDPAFRRSLLVITWDEGTTNEGGGGRVATLVISPSVPHGMRSDVSHTHYSLLRTIEEAWGLGCLEHSCSANDLREFFPG
jgi:phosphatidylinositol-3-phosphatase